MIQHEIIYSITYHNNNFIIIVLRPGYKYSSIELVKSLTTDEWLITTNSGNSFKVNQDELETQLTNFMESIYEQEHPVVP